MNLEKLSKINVGISEIRTIISDKTKDFHLSANTHQLIYLEDAENFEAHYTMDFIRISFSHGKGDNNKNKTILISFDSINSFLIGLKQTAINYDGKYNFLRYVEAF